MVVIMIVIVASHQFSIQYFIEATSLADAVAAIISGNSTILGRLKVDDHIVGNPIIERSNYVVYLASEVVYYRMNPERKGSTWTYRDFSRFEIAELIESLSDVVWNDIVGTKYGAEYRLEV